MTKIKDIVTQGIKDGLSNDEIIDAVREKFPSANTSKASVSWYRSQMKKDGHDAKAAADGRLKRALSHAIETTEADRKTGGPVYEVRGVKTFRGMEGQGFNVTLYRDGIKVAFIIDEGCGGCLIFEWVDHMAPRVEAPARVWDGKESGHVVGTMRMTPEEAKLWGACLAMAPYLYEGVELDVDPDLFVGELVEAFDAERTFKKNMAKIIPYRYADTPVGSILFAKGLPPTEANVDRVRKGITPKGGVLFADMEHDEAVYLMTGHKTRP